MEKQRITPLKIPEHLCESEYPLEKAKAYTLQLFLLAHQLGNKDLISKLSTWIGELDSGKLTEVVMKYEKSQKLAEKRISYIRYDLQKYIKDVQCSYKKDTDVNDVTTPLEVDGFLFEDLDDALRHAGLHSDRFCEKCKSSNVREIPVIFSSNSVGTLLNLYGILLKAVVKSKRISVLASGEGSLVYGAALFTDADSIISYETKGSLRDVQISIVNKYGLKSRVQVRPIEEFLTVDLINDVDVLICGEIWEHDDTKLFQDRINAYLTTKEKVFVCKNTSDIDVCFPLLVNLQKVENSMSTQEFNVYIS